MRRNEREYIFLGAVLIFICLSAGLGQTPVAAEKISFPSAAEHVAKLYDLVSSPGGHLPDWEKVRSSFLKEAVIVLRTSRTALTAFGLEGFIQDFIDFYGRAYKMGTEEYVPQKTGFTEKVVRMKTWEFGDMAHILVLYEAYINGSPMRPQQGIDSWLLVRRDGRWLIAAATNEIVTPANPVPAELRESK